MGGLWLDVLAALFAGSLAGGALACGDDDEDDAPGAVSTGLPADARLSELTDAERAQTCRAFVDAVSDALQGQLAMIQCEVDAVRETIAISLSGQVRFDLAQCEQRVAACLAAPPDAGTDAGVGAAVPGLDCTPAATEAQRSCDATVAQYERCWSAVVTDFDDFGSVISCEHAVATLEASSGMMSAGTRVPPPDCAELMRLCPQISIPGTRPVE